MKHLSSIFAVIMLSFAVPAWLNAQEYAPVPVTISKEKVKVDGKVYYSHIVLERQTLYSISKAYNVTIDQIYEANPAVKAEGLKKNAIILIPEAVQDSRNIPERQPKQKQKKTGSDEYIIHTVKWYENLEAISEKYGVPVEAIMEVNGLTGNKLRKRQKLMIPVGGTWSVQAAADTTAVQAAAEDSPVRKQEETAIAAESGKVNAVLVMPFDAHGLKPRTGSIDFYSGTLMAVKELGDRGADIDLNVYDASGGVIPVTEERLGLSDIVIGPVSAGDLAKTLDKCPDHTFIVSPLDHRDLRKGGEKHRNDGSDEHDSRKRRDSVQHILLQYSGRPRRSGTSHADDESERCEQGAGDVGKRSLRKRCGEKPESADSQ